MMISRVLALLVLLSGFFILVGCGEGYDEVACRQSVVEEVGTVDVFTVPGRKFHFVARDQEGRVWFIKTMGTGPEVSSKTLIFDVPETCANQ